MQIKHQIYTKSRQINTASTYKKIPDKISNKVNADGKKIVENKEVVNRLFVNGRNSCFIPSPQTTFFKQPQSSLTKPSPKRT